MNYLSTMGNLLSFTPTQWETQKDIKQLQLYCIINVLILGLVYGCSAALFSKMVLVERGFDATAANAAKIIIAGIPVAFFMHAGAALFIWVFLKAMGGKADFMTSYFHIGAAAISVSRKAVGSSASGTLIARWPDIANCAGEYRIDKYKLLPQVNYLIFIKLPIVACASTGLRHRWQAFDTTA